MTLAKIKKYKTPFSYDLREMKVMNYDEKAFRDRYGQTPQSEAQVTAYLKGLKVVIAADGEISRPEMMALRKGMQRLGVSEEIVSKIEKFDPRGVSLTQILTDLRPGGRRARMLVYDCIIISSADGHYALEERAAAAHAASILGVSKATLQSLEALVELEAGVRRLHRAIFPQKKKSHI